MAQVLESHAGMNVFFSSFLCRDNGHIYISLRECVFRMWTWSDSRYASGAPREVWISRPCIYLPYFKAPVNL